MRTRPSESLRDDYEVAVIGGGVNGAGIAEALAAAGYIVVLLERHDFGSGTTSRSTRLVHGGLRYLEHGEFGLVYESLSERAALLQLYPHLVKPLRLLLPLYKGGAYPRWKARAGLALYDLLSLGRGLGGHQSLDRGRTLEREPRLSSSGLAGALVFSDAQVDLAERLALECALAARDFGADVANYAEVQGVRAQPDGRLRLTVRDSIEGPSVEVTADIVINSTGPWVDAFLQRSGVNRPPLIGGTRGSHIVLPAERVGLKQAIYAPARSDGRPFFVLPWLDMLLVGTTDVRHGNDPDEARASAAEVTYLLSETNALLNSELTVEDVIYTYAGVRPLPFEEDVSEAAITRRHFLVDHTSDGMPGVYSLVGGKLTTFRSVGRKTVQLVGQRLGERWPVARTAAAGDDPPVTFKQLWGARAPEVYERYRQEADLLQPICEHSAEPRAAIVEAFKYEQATTIADVFLRRTSVGWRRCQGHHVAKEAADLIGKHLGWNEPRRSLEVARYLEEASRVHPGVVESGSLVSAARP